ncbi:MAG: ribosome maturation factor RimM [Salinibacter sp.]
MPATDVPPDPQPEYADIPAEALVQIGFVYRPHGIEGELKINPEHTDDPTRFEELSHVYVGAQPRHVRTFAVRSVRYQETKRGTTVILGLKGVATRSDAEAITKMTVFAAEEDLELADDEFFVHELVGLEVVTENGTVLGTVSNFQEMPAHEVFVVRRSEGGETMVPAVEDFILDVDLEAGRVTVRPIDGLLD